MSGGCLCGKNDCETVSSVKKTSLKKITVFLLIPGIGSALLIAAYFSGTPWLRAIISPSINREYGLLENLQLLMLLIIIACAAFGIVIKRTRTEKTIMAVILAASLFMFLEEFDYGLHYYRLLTGNPLVDSETEKFINVHNIGEASPKFKLVGDLTLIVLFIVFPLFFSRSRNRLLRYLTPDRFFILTVILMFVISRIAHVLEDGGVGGAGSLHGSISEFRELLTYYVFALYFFELVFRRNYREEPPWKRLPED